MIRVWGRANSTNVKKALWCAQECGLKYERLDLGGPFGGLDTPQFREMNPFGQIPVLEDGDLVLRESNTIVRYLADRYGQPPLRPADAAARAAAGQWMDWAASSLMPAYSVLFMGLVRTPSHERDEEAIAEARMRIGTLLEPVDALLLRSNFLTGDTFGIADIPLGTMSYALFELGAVPPGQRGLTRWYEDLLAREPYRRTVAIGLS